MLGIFVALAIRPLAEWLGGGAEGFRQAGILFAVALALPWFAVHRATFERPDYASRPVSLGIADGFRACARHPNFVRLVGLYLGGRIAIDLIGALLILYFAYWIGRPSEFEPTMAIFLLTAICSLPIWLAVARHTSKLATFTMGAAWWSVCSLALFWAHPDWPRWALYGVTAATAVGFAVVDMMPWSMIGDVIDEDDLATGERREGVYHGVFAFLRKLGGALAVFLTMTTLEFVGFERGRPQSDNVLLAIRLFVSLVPAAFLMIAVYLGRNYSLTRDEHVVVLEALEERKRNEFSPA